MSKLNSYFFKSKISVTFIMLIFSFFIVSEFFSTVASAETIKKRQISSSQAKQYRNQKTVSVISGGVNGTYIRFATDMSNVLDEKKKGGLRVLPIVGRGGGQNVIDVLFLKGVHMGIIQQEVTEFLKEKDPVLYKNVGKKVHYITKLYNAEFTMVARKDIKSLEDLKGKTVSFWKPWSATDVGGQTILKKLGLDKDIKVVHMDTSLGIQKVKDGEIAAVMLVAGAPIGGFKDLKSTEGLHFVPISKKSLPNHDFSKVLDVYLPSHLRHEDYPFMIAEGETVSTIVSSAVLVVYNFSESSSEYKKVEVFVNSLFDNWAKFLKSPRHPKWKNINFAAKIPGWIRFKPAQKWLAKNKTNRP
ncbi:MAG: TAXI family TRAP transporter solute-binding subunit [Rhodomicrobiaceae bacterium]